MARNPSALIWISQKASKVQRKHKNMKWKTAIKEASAQYHKKHGPKKVAKKNLEKEKSAPKYNTLDFQSSKFYLRSNFRSISVYHVYQMAHIHAEHNHDKQCSICYYEMSILEFGTRQKMA